MAPRTRRQAAGAPAPAQRSACSFADVPTGVLQHILGFLDSQKDRHRAVLVCRQWHDCVHSPDICGEVEANGFHSSAAFDSLACWLRRHGQHVRSLRLLARGYHVFNAPTMAEAEETLLLGCCLAACAPAGQLQRLRIESGSVPVLAAWVQPLRSLRELSLVARSEDVTIKCSLEHCTQLTALCLEGDEVVFADGVRLPPSLRRMLLVDECSAALPAQMSALIQLSGLRLVCNTEWDADSCNVLLQLPALRSLDISNFYVLPSCLGQLTALEELVLIQSPESGDDETLAAELNAALPQLERLTSLLIDAWEIQAGLPALTSLFRLHRLYLNGGSELPLSLPAGPWMGSLRELGASWTYLCASTQALAAAAQLERVAVVNGLDAQVQPSPQLFGWLAEHPPLRDLEMYPGDEGLHGSMRSAVAGLKQGRPGLQVALIHEAALDAVFRASCRTLLDFF